MFFFFESNDFSINRSRADRDVDDDAAAVRAFTVDDDEPAVFLGDRGNEESKWRPAFRFSSSIASRLSSSSLRVSADSRPPSSSSSSSPLTFVTAVLLLEVSLLPGKSLGLALCARGTDAGLEQVPPDEAGDRASRSRSSDDALINLFFKASANVAASSGSSSEHSQEEEEDDIDDDHR